MLQAKLDELSELEKRVRSIRDFQSAGTLALDDNSPVLRAQFDLANMTPAPSTF